MSLVEIVDRDGEAIWVNPDRISYVRTSYDFGDNPPRHRTAIRFERESVIVDAAVDDVLAQLAVFPVSCEETQQ